MMRNKYILKNKSILLGIIIIILSIIKSIINKNTEGIFSLSGYFLGILTIVISIISKKLKSKNIHLTYYTFIITIIIIELISLILLICLKRPLPKNYYEKNNLYNTIKDQFLGYKLKINDTFNAVKKINNTIIYNVTYNTDEFGRRTIYQNISPKKKHLILLGGSYTFGEGLNNNETLMYHILNKTNEYNIFNYAVHGYGTKQIETQFLLGEMKNQVMNNSGYAIYIFIEDHILRNKNSLSRPWTTEIPRYKKVGNELKQLNKPTILNKIPIFLSKALYKIKEVSCFLTLINFGIPDKITDDDIIKTYNMIMNINSLYKEYFNGKLIVLIHPEKIKSIKTKKLFKLLENSNIQIINVSIDNYEKYKIPGDGHPTSKANEIIANKIISFLENESNN